MFAFGCGDDAGNPEQAANPKVPPSTPMVPGTPVVPSTPTPSVPPTAEIATKPPAVASCAVPGNGVDCDDGRACNGLEVCDPGKPGARANGCVAGTPVRCGADETCDESRDGQCSACGAVSDNDLDGHKARECGGDDCDDSDLARFPRSAELCDGIDNDCDGVVDGAPANTACTAPSGGSASCVAAICAQQCTKSEYLPVNGVCMPRGSPCSGVLACGTGACVPTGTSYTCTCGAGFALAADAKSCVQSAPVCPPGLQASAGACVDIDECLAANGGCAQTCTNEVGSFTCSCGAGFELATDGKGCTPLSTACADDNACGPGTCTLIAGAPSCTCPAGYSGTGTASCQDIDECLVNNGGCNVGCWNSVGTYKCACGGFDVHTADGIQCRAPAWREDTVLTDQGGAFYPSVAMAASGKALVTWSQNTPSFSTRAMSYVEGRWGAERLAKSSTGPIVGQAYLHEAGYEIVAGWAYDLTTKYSVWTSEGELPTERTLEVPGDWPGQNSGRVLMVGSGTPPLLVWDRGMAGGIIVRQARASGGWETSIPFGANVTDGTQRSELSAALSQDGTLHLLWMETREGSSETRVLTAYLRGGTGNVLGMWDTPRQLAVGGTAPGNTAAIEEYGGRVHFFWILDGQVQHSITEVDRAGGTQTASDMVDLVPGASGIDGYQLLNVVGGAQVAVSWTLGEDRSVLGANVWRAGYWKWDRNTLLDLPEAQIASGPAVFATQREGHLHAIWTVNAGGEHRLYDSFAEGSSWAPPELLRGTSALIQQHAVASDSEGRATLVWEERPEGGATRIMAKRYD